MTTKQNPPMPFSDGDETFNAGVGLNGVPTNGTYFRGYKKTVDILFEYLSKTQGRNIDNVVYPFLYSCRHVIELMLKEAIIQVDIIEGKTDIQYQGIHSLTFDDEGNQGLFQKCCYKLKLLDRRRFIPILNEIGIYILEIAKFDNTEQTFRYAFDTKGIKHLVNRHYQKLFQYRNSNLENIKNETFLI